MGKLKSVPYVVTIEVDVYDARELIKAARAKASAEGIKLKNCSARDALQWMLDPGVSPVGSDITHSFCERLPLWVE